MGVIHVRHRCAVRAKHEHIAGIRRLVSPQDHRFDLVPDLRVATKWCVEGVPQHISPMRLSAALLEALGWRQAPLSASRKGCRKGQHRVYLGAEIAPKADSVMVEGSVCLIRSDEQVSQSLAESILVEPSKDEAMNSAVESASSSTRTSALEQKMQRQVDIAKEALQQEASRAAKTNEANVEERLMSKVQDRMATLEAKVAEIDDIKNEVLKVKQGCEVTHSAVVGVQQNLAGIETVIENKVTIAAHNLEKSMSGKFDDLGDKPMRSLAAMARKREGEAAPSESADAKMQKGFGGVKRRRKPLNAKARRRKPAAQRKHGAGESKKPEDVEVTDVDEEAVQEEEEKARERMLADQMQVRLISWPRGRRKWTMWRSKRSSVQELHWEYARVSRRGAGRFRLASTTGDSLNPETLIKDLDPEAAILVIAEDPAYGHNVREDAHDLWASHDEWMQRLLQLESRVEAVEDALARQAHVEGSSNLGMHSIPHMSEDGKSANSTAATRETY